MSLLSWFIALKAFSQCKLGTLLAKCHEHVYWLEAERHCVVCEYVMRCTYRDKLLRCTWVGCRVVYEYVIS